MRPLNALKNSSIELSSGNLDTRISANIANRKDNIALVASAFNQMATRIQLLVGYQRQFLHDLSHELRTPLTRLELAIDIATENNIRTLALQPRFRKDVAEMKALVEDTLTLAWLETEPTLKCIDHFNLSTLLDIICNDAQFEYPKRKIHRNYPQEIPIKNTNQRALSQSIENILRNALKYSENHTQVSIKYSPKNNHHHFLEVIDQGIGVNSKDLQNIFMPFYRSDAARSRTAGGVGLGLALTKRQIESLRGRVSAQNNATVGLCVMIELPKE